MRLMLSKVIRILALWAVLLMPFGMTTQAAAAHHEGGASVSIQHCPDEQPEPTDTGIAQCAMGCTAGMPDLGAPSPARLKITCVPPTGVAPRALHDIPQDIATPPPKNS